MSDLQTPLEIAPGLTLLGYCTGCGGARYADDQLPLCGWCVIRRLKDHPDEELTRRRVWAAEGILAMFNSKQIRQLTDLSPAEVRAVRRNISERVKGIFLSHGGTKWRERLRGRPQNNRQN